MNKLIKIFIILLILVIPVIAEVEYYKYPIGTLFQTTDNNIYMISGYAPGQYVLTSVSGDVNMDKLIVETWAPLELETSWEKNIRHLNIGAVIGGEIRPTYYGDLDGNNVYSKIDASIAVEAFQGSYIFNNYQKVAADVNGDGIFDKKDTVIMVLYFFNQQPTLPYATTGTQFGKEIPNVNLQPNPTVTPIPIPIVTSVTPLPGVGITSYPVPTIDITPTKTFTFANATTTPTTTTTTTTTTSIPTQTLRDNLDGRPRQTTNRECPSGQELRSGRCVTTITIPPELPGFEAIFAIAGLIGVVYMVLRQKKEEYRK